MPNSIINIHNPIGVKYLTRLGIRFSYPKEHKFEDLADPIFSCSSGIKTINFSPLHKL